MTDPALFDVSPFLVPPNPAAPEKELSADRRRVMRQAEAIARGGHPLGLVVRDIRMHADPGSRSATKENAASRPRRCGTCRFREQVSGAANCYPKCMWRPERDQPGPGGRHRTAQPRYTAGPATDVRAWWPACTDFEPVPDG